jgi:hypothetical protein
MDSYLQPWKTLSATTGVGILSEGWNLAEAPSPGEARVYRLEVPFAEPFMNAPVVHAGLTGFDLDRDCSGRLSLKIADISPMGFYAEICTWDDSLVYAVEFSWLAIGG